MSEHIPGARKHLESLKVWVRVAAERDDTSSQVAWSEASTAIAGLIQDYENLREANRPVPADYGDVSDLPLSLRRELAFLKTDDLDDQIYMIVKAAERGADLDNILIELWRRFGVEQKRRFIQNKAYRLSLKKVIHSVNGRKGLYAATAEQAQQLSPTGTSDAPPVTDFDSLMEPDEGEDPA